LKYLIASIFDAVTSKYFVNDFEVIRKGYDSLSINNLIQKLS